MKKLQKTKNIYLTFDYELFLKQSGTAQHCLFEPTHRLIALLLQYNAKATFFVDILYYEQLLLRPELHQTANEVKQQIQHLLLNGHQIELHIHSHWPSARFEHGEWWYDAKEDYRLQTFTNQEIESIIERGSVLLEQICREVQPTYKITAFRAGGLCITPFEPLANALKKRGIMIDSSVACNIKNTTKNQFYDFSKSVCKDVYRFDTDPLTESTNGQFLEFQIASYRRTLFAKFRDKLFESYTPDQWKIAGDGKGLAQNVQQSHFEQLISKFASQTTTLSLEACTPSALLRNIKRHSFNNIVLLSHPKLLTDVSFLCLDALLQQSYSFKTLHEYEE